MVKPFAARDPDTCIEPASLTKLMTAHLTFKALKEKRLTLEQQLTVSQKGWRTEGSRMLFDPRIPVSVNDLIHGMIIQSGNDACVTLAEAIAGSEEVFGQLMTREASPWYERHQLPKRHRVTGAQHYTTVRDLGILANALGSAISQSFIPFIPRKNSAITTLLSQTGTCCYIVTPTWTG